MVSKKIYGVIILLLVTIMGVAPPLAGARPDRPMPPGRWWRLPKVAEELQITEDETQALDDAFISFRRNAIDLKGDIEKQRLELDIILDKEPFDEAAALKQFEKIDAARSAMAYKRFEVLLQVRKILGQNRFELLKQRFRHFRRHRMSGHGPHPHERAARE